MAPETKPLLGIQPLEITDLIQDASTGLVVGDCGTHGFRTWSCGGAVPECSFEVDGVGDDPVLLPGSPPIVVINNCEPPPDSSANAFTPLQAYDALTGALLWKRPDLHRVYMMAEATGKTVRGLAVTTGRLAYVLDAATGRTLHSFPSRTWLASGRAERFASFDEETVALHRVIDGRVAWKKTLPNSDDDAPRVALTEDTVLIAAGELLQAFDYLGAERWTADLPAGWGAWTAPAICADGWLLSLHHRDKKTLRLVRVTASRGDLVKLGTVPHNAHVGPFGAFAPDGARLRTRIPGTVSLAAGPRSG